MPNPNMQALPPEMQQRINDIIAQAQAQAPAPAAPAAAAPVAAPAQVPAAPIAKPPSLMDHVIAMRQDIAELQASINAVAQVTDAVGNAVGQLYATFHEQTQPTNFSANFQAQAPQQPVESDY